MFLTGFLVGTVVTYLICLEEDILPLEGKLGLSLLAGFLCGLITMLVQYVGLFLTGFCVGTLLAVMGLLITDFFYTPTTLWLPIGVLFLSGVVMALAILYFQKSLTIIGTSLIGSALMCVALDYYVHQFMMVYFVYDVIKLESEGGGSRCWYNWVVLGAWPVVCVLGAVIQFGVTGKGVDHREGKSVRTVLCAETVIELTLLALYLGVLVRFL